MSGRDEWVEKQAAKDAKSLVRRTNDRAKAEALTTPEEIHELVCKLAVKASEYAALAERLAKAGHFEPFLSCASTSSAASHIASDLLYAHGSGRPVSLKARLDSAREWAAPPDRFDRDQLKAHEKLLAKPTKQAKAVAA